MTIQTLVNTSSAAWEGWNNLGYQARTRILRHWTDQLAAECRAMVEYQCRQAEEHVAPTLLMPGPTGETNELYCAGRGCFVVTADNETPLVAFFGQLAAALVTGNTVFVCLPADYPVKAKDVAAQLEQSGCAGGVITAIDNDQLADLVSHPAVAGVAYAGKLSTTQALGRQLAARDGLLAQLISETDTEQLPVIGSPTYSLRFVTERTRTINITAVGGNATLLELGSGEEH
ncbi:aldehyde dehydrogenase family protein (plasmid) [Photobacterium sp. DA100]|uniref:aldehyde dehydrogenase family protein n=1 Tax=Photobacterium sp. DA100 TaxID=3027472 RepID=UPI00247AB6B2|nr:aldehyde dehydrogenase family protein [Photobacterium sp. DA100]WEM44888.1 aldehyde dehydrogenase family protein [Photobacterium sp. DA100]